MVLACDVCNEGIGSDGQPCIVCGGDGEIDLLDPAFGRMSLPASMKGLIWSAILDKLDANAAELDYIHGKVTAIWNQVKP